MWIIDRYIFKTIAVTVTITLLVMLVLDVFFNLINELEDVGQGTYNIADIIRYLGLTLPRRIYEILPVALLVGGLLGMGALASGSELIVLRASGVSTLRLVVAALQAGLVIGIGVFLLGEFIAPHTERLAQQLRAQAKYGQAALSSSQGFWARDGQQFIHVGAILPDGRLGAIRILVLDEALALQTMIVAEQAVYENGGWQLSNIVQHRLTASGVISQNTARGRWNSALKPDTLDVLKAEPEDLSLQELHTYTRYLRENRLDTRHYELAFWTKTLAPLTNLAMLMIAMPFAFGPTRSVGTGQRLVIGVLIGLLFFLLNRMLGNWVLLSGLPPWLGALVPTVVFFAAGTVPLVRMR